MTDTLGKCIITKARLIVEEDKIWLAVWKLIAIVTCILIVTVGVCTVYTNDKISKADDPLAYACATSANPTICLTYAGQKNE